MGCLFFEWLLYTFTNVYYAIYKNAKYKYAYYDS